MCGSEVIVCGKWGLEVNLCCASGIIIIRIVLTTLCFRYNNKTYRVDDIAWDKNPMCTFQDHRGNAITFVDYYK